MGSLTCRRSDVNPSAAPTNFHRPVIKSYYNIIIPMMTNMIEVTCVFSCFKLNGLASSEAGPCCELHN